MDNYFYNLPTELQEKIYFELHKKYMYKISRILPKFTIQQQVKWCSYQDWISYHSTKSNLSSVKYLFI